METDEMIGRYRVLRTIDAGGFATVYLAEDPGLASRVAIKVLSPRMAADIDIRTRFISEARVMRRLEAPELITVYDIGEQDGLPYFVMEYCEAGTLADRLAALGGPITIDEALGLADLMATATGGIHAADVVHRDLKPSNYLIRMRTSGSGQAVGRLLRADEELVLGDFGLAKELQLSSTQLSIAAGTPGYGAPEQFRADGASDRRADVYALSAVVVAAMSGHQPTLVVHPDDRPFPSEALAACGPLAPALEQGLAYERTQRQADAAEWLASLRRLAPGPAPDPGPPPGPRGEEAAHTRPSPPPTNPSPTERPTEPAGPGRGRRRLTVPAAAAVAVLVGIIVAMVIALGGGSPIVGPQRGAVGDEVAFAAEVDGPTSWRVGGQDAGTSDVLLVTPSSPGRLRIEATSADGTVELDYRVDERSGPLAIEGPGLAPLGATTVLVAGGADGATFTWTVGGATSTGQAIEVTPTSVGTLTVELRSSDGQSVERTLTVLARSN
ncbi:MAG: serine/threonine-protein kinase [Actinomycetota bacterium]